MVSAPIAGRHQAALVGRKSLHAASTKRISGDKEKVTELLRQATLKSTAFSGLPVTTNSSAAAAQPAPMQVTVTPPHALGDLGMLASQPHAYTRGGVEIMQTIVASPNTTPRDAAASASDPPRESHASRAAAAALAAINVPGRESLGAPTVAP
jgi:hypothetical protein